MRLKQKLRYHIAFYKTTLKLSLLATFVVFLLSVIGAFPFTDIVYVSALAFPSFGLTLHAFYNLTMHKNEYFFYHNASCSLVELYTVSFILSSTVSILLYQVIVTLWTIIWK